MHITSVMGDLPQDKNGGFHLVAGSTLMEHFHEGIALIRLM